MLLVGLLWLAASWFVSGGCACYLSFRLWYFGKSGLSQARRSRRHRKTSSKQKKTECHRRGQQPTPHACKLNLTNTRQQVNNERQQENQESGQKLPMKIVPRRAGWRSSLHKRKPNKISRISYTETFLQHMKPQSQ